MTRSALVLRQASLIVACAAVAGVAAWAVTVSLPRPFCAVAGVSVVAQANDVAPWGREAALRRRALVALVPDLSIADSVLARFGENLPLALRTPEALLACIQADDSAGDLLRIHARTGDAALSARLADAWARAYVEKTNATQAFCADAESRRRVEASYAKACERLRVAEAAVAAHEASSRTAELRARLDRAQALLSRVALQRAELVRDVWARVHRERMKRVERDVCGAPAAKPAPPATERGLIEEIRGVLANLGVRKDSETPHVVPIAQPRVLRKDDAAGLAASGGLSALKATDADLSTLEREDAARWEPLCARMSGDVEALSGRLSVLDAERKRLGEEQSAASKECHTLLFHLLARQLDEATRAPLVRFVLSAVPPVRSEGPDPRSASAVAAGLAALVAWGLRPRRTLDPPATPRVFDVLP